MKLKKTDRLYKIGMFCIVLAFVLGATINLLTELVGVTENHRLVELLAGVATIALIIFVWNGLRLWFYYFEKVRLRYSSLNVMMYVGCHVLAGYWAYTKLRKHDQTIENI